MASTLRKVAFGVALAVGGVVGFGYTDPSWTRRKFNPSKCPPLRCESPPTRAACLKQLQAHGSPDTPLDVLVVGGGSVGAGVALDAVTRGLTCGLLEMNDFASGSSSRSTKLIHGGIRYLEKAVFHLDPGQLSLVAEALRERTIMIHQAPHLCHALPTLVPCYHPYDVLLYWCGVKTYDFIAALGGGTLEYSSFVWPYTTMNYLPTLKHENSMRELLLGAVQYYDGVMNDARVCLSAILTAACYGAPVVNYAKVESMEIVLNGAGERVVKTSFRDTTSDKVSVVYSKAVVNACGPFSASLSSIAHEKKVSKMMPSAGSHIVLDKKHCPKGRAMVVPSSDGRVVFAIPWLDGCVVGTTDRPCETTDCPTPTSDEIDFLLKNVKEYIGPVSRSDVKSSWCGIRPLAVGDHVDLQGGTQNIVREHQISVDPDALIINVTGGKWTTYRRIAEETVDKLATTLLQGRAQFAKCTTTDLQLIGARRLAEVATAPPPGIPEDVYAHWRSNYGDRCAVLQEMVARDPKQLQRVTGAWPIVEAEVRYSVECEHCERVADFISRRTRMSFLNLREAEAAVPRVTEVMAQVHGWSRSRAKSEARRAMDELKQFIV